MEEENQEVKLEIREPNPMDTLTIIKIVGKMKIKKDIFAWANKGAEFNRKIHKLKNGVKNHKEEEQLNIEIENIKAELGMEVPIIIIENIEKAEQDVKSFFMSLVGVNEKEYMKMDGSTPIKIINELMNHPKWQKVFTDALKLFGK